MSLMTTLAPSRASVSAHAAPIPDAAPVTIAIFPSTCPMTTSRPRSTADLHDEAAERVDPGIVAGVEHRRRRDLLDDRRPHNRVAGQQCLAPPYRAGDPVAAAGARRLEEGAAGAASRL